MKYVTCREFDAAIAGLKEDIREIKENHLTHIESRINGLSNRIFLLIILIIITGFLAGVNVLNILMNLGGV